VCSSDLAGLTYKIPFFVTPGSRAVQVNIEKDGFVKDFEDAGATVLAKACARSVPASSALRTSVISEIARARLRSVIPMVPATVLNTQPHHT
jgi:aconitase A